MKQKQIAKIHILKKELQLDDDLYRMVLERTTGKNSAKDMNPKELNLVIDELNRLNGKNGISLFKPSPCPKLRKIYKLWSELHKKGIVKQGSNLSLNNFVERFHISLEELNQEFAYAKEKSEIIEALKSMQKRSAGARVYKKQAN